MKLSESSPVHILIHILQKRKPFGMNKQLGQDHTEHNWWSQGYVGMEAYTFWGALFKKKSTKFGKKVNIYLE